MAGFQTGFHGGGSGRLHANDLHLGVQELGKRGHACGQSAAADGNQDHIHIGKILKNFIGDGALAGGQSQIIEGVDIGESLLFRQLCGQSGSIVKDLAVKNDLCTVVLSVVYLYQGSSGGHDNGGCHTGCLSGVGYALSVVAR